MSFETGDRELSTLPITDRIQAVKNSINGVIEFMHNPYSTDSNDDLRNKDGKVLISPVSSMQVVEMHDLTQLPQASALCQFLNEGFTRDLQTYKTVTRGIPMENIYFPNVFMVDEYVAGGLNQGDELSAMVPHLAGVTINIHLLQQKFNAVQTLDEYEALSRKLSRDYLSHLVSINRIHEWRNPNELYFGFQKKISFHPDGHPLFRHDYSRDNLYSSRNSPLQALVLRPVIEVEKDSTASISEGELLSQREQEDINEYTEKHIVHYLFDSTQWHQMVTSDDKSISPNMTMLHQQLGQIRRKSRLSRDDFDERLIAPLPIDLPIARQQLRQLNKMMGQSFDIGQSHIFTPIASETKNGDPVVNTFFISMQEYEDKTTQGTEAIRREVIGLLFFLEPELYRVAQTGSLNELAQ